MVRVEGVEPLRRGLKRYADEFPKATKEAIQIAGFNLQARAKRSVPVDTGKLRQSIVVDISEDGFTATVTAGGAIAPYAAYIEFGTGGAVEIPEGWEEIAAAFKGKGIRKVNIQAQPFLADNFRKERNRLTARIKKAIAKIP